MLKHRVAGALLLLAVVAAGGAWLAVESSAPGGVAVAALPPQGKAPEAKPTPVGPSRTGPAVTITPGGDEVPRLATVRIAFRDEPRVAEGDRLVSIEPAIEGSFVWDGDRTLLFQPAFPGWQRGQRYELRINGATAGLVRDFTHAFTVEGALEVAYVIPGDGDVEVPTEAQVLVQFNRSVAALTVLQEGDAPPVLEFDPPLAGKGEWLNTSLYRFVPTDLRPSTTYRVRIPAGLTSAADGVLASDSVWSFATIQPAVASFEPADGTQFVEPDGPFVVTFNQPMDRTSVEASVELRPESGEAVATTVEWSEGDTLATLTPDAPLTLGGSYAVVVRAGLAGADGGVTASERVAQFTVVELPRLVSTYPKDGETDAGVWSITLEYNNPMDSESIEGRLSISGIDPDALDIWGYDSRISVEAPLRYSTEYTVRIAAGARDRGGRALSAHSFSFTTAAPPPSLSFATPGAFATFSSADSQVLFFHAANLDAVHFRIHRLPEADSDWYLKSGNVYEYWRETSDSERAQPIREWTVRIGEGLQDNSRLYATQLADTGSLPKGDYMLSASSDSLSRDRSLHVSVVDTSIVTKLAHDELLVWVLDHTTGEPLVGVETRTRRAHRDAPDDYLTATTDADGLARFAVTAVGTNPWAGYGDHIVRVAGDGRHGVSSTRWGPGAWPREPQPWVADNYRPQERAYVFSDRPIYRPGETVYLKGIARAEDDASYALPGSREGYSLQIRDPRSPEGATPSDIELNELGSFTTEYAVLAGAATGRYSVFLLRGERVIGSTSFVVAEFRVPEFEVEVDTVSDDYVAGEAIAAEATALFYFGSPVADAAMQWHAQSRPTAIRVEGYEDYSFSDNDYWRQPETTAWPAQGSAHTDDTGRARFDVPTASEEGAGTLEFTLSATVRDSNAQTVSGSTTVTVHPATWYAGIRPESYIAKAEVPLSVDIVTVDFERQIASARPVTVRIYEREWVRSKERPGSGGYRYRYEPVDTEIQVREVTTDDAGEASFEFAPPKSGSYRLVAESTDDTGRVARSSRFVWVSGRDYAPWQVRDDDLIELVADRDEYKVGDVAEVLVPAPFAGATALVTIERGTVLSSEVRTFETNSEVLRIPIEDGHIPNVFVGVVLYRAPTEDDPLPRYHVGYVELQVSTAPRRLDVRIEPDREEALPGETVSYEVMVTDSEGRGVAADVAVAIVDEAVLALASGPARDGMDAFWFDRWLSVRTASSLTVSADRSNAAYADTAAGQLALEAAERGVFAEAAMASADDGGTRANFAAPSALSSEPSVRRNFQRTALWIGQLTTDEDGTANFELHLPDNTTTWNALARAVTTSTQVGRGESDLLVTQPLLVRPALPRFLRVADSAMLRTLVTNRTDETREVTATVEAQGVTLDDRDPRSATVEPGDSAIFEWPARALEEGTATVRFTATTSGYGDAVEISLPVHLDVTPETTATGGIVEDTPAVEAVYLPDYVITRSGSLEIGLQGSLVGALDEELRHFKPYRYESTVRVASRVVAIVAAGRATSGGVDTAWERQLEEDVQDLISRRAYISDWSWGWGWGWCSACSPDPLSTGWVLSALGEARDTGQSVPDNVLADASNAITGYLERQSDVEQPADPNEHAFLLYALADASNDGREVSALAREHAVRIRELVDERRAELTNWGRAYALLDLLATGHDADHTAVRAMLNDLTADTIASANGNHWEDPHKPGSMHNATVRITAIVLRALTEVDPDHPLIEETARWLALARSADRWKSSVERAQGMASLGAYAELTGETRGVYDYSVLVNTDTVLDGRFDVPAGDYLDAASVALADLPLGEVSRVQFERESGTPGRLYYGLNLRYVTPAAGIEALNRGFAVSHRYSLLEDPETPITSASVGDVVRVTVTVVAPADRLFVQVEDSLPAGLEPIDPQLNIVSPRLREQLREEQAEAVRANAPGYCAPWYGWCYSPWEQVDVRDDRLVLQASRLTQGVHEYVYYARATTPGDFFVAPVHAEETYLPEVFGRSDSSRFTVLGGE